MKVGHVALATAILALVIGILALLAGPDSSVDADSSVDDGVIPAPVEARLVSLEARFDEMAASIGEVSRQSAKTNAALAQLGESVDALRRTTERLAEEDAAQAAIPPGVKFHDSFEAGTDGWVVLRFMPIITGDVKQTTEEGRAKDGRGALAFTYTQEEGKLPVAVRMANRINRLSLWIRTLERPAEIHIGANEWDDSNYGTVVHLEPDQGWKRFEFDLSTFRLDDHSHDENARLDYEQIKGVAIADLSGFMGRTGGNVLLVDDVIGEFRAAEDQKPGGKKDVF